MSFIEEIKKRASNQIKTIVLPEATDIRILEATDIIGKEGFAKIILLGNESEIISIANENKLNISNSVSGINVSLAKLSAFFSSSSVVPLS